MSSALGKQLGLTDESTLEEVAITISNIIDYSNSIQMALKGSSSDSSVSRYRTNGSNIEIAPAKGLWNSWGWDTSCIKIPISGIMNMTYRNNLYAGQSSGSRVLTYNIPVGKPGFMILWEDYISMEPSTSCCVVSGCTRLFVTGALYHMQYDEQKLGLYKFNGGETITINRRAGETRDTLAGVYMFMIY